MFHIKKYTVDSWLSDMHNILVRPKTGKKRKKNHGTKNFIQNNTVKSMWYLEIIIAL